MSPDREQLAIIHNEMARLPSDSPELAKLQKSYDRILNKGPMDDFLEQKMKKAVSLLTSITDDSDLLITEEMVLKLQGQQPKPLDYLIASATNSTPQAPNNKEVKVTSTSPSEALPPCEHWTLNSERDWVESKEEIDFFPEGTPAAHVIMVGRTLSGKSHMLKSFLYKYMVVKKYFKFGVVFSKTAAINGEYSWLPQEYITSDCSEDKIKQWVNQLKQKRSQYKKASEMPHSFMLFDDAIGHLNTKSQWWGGFISSIRHLNCSVIILAQKLEGFVSPVTRVNVRYYFIFKSLLGDEIKRIKDRVGGGISTNTKEFNEFWKRTVEIPYACLVFDDQAPTVEKSYHRLLAPKELPDWKIKF